eukprot:TRINITY_DN8894_c0_g1_i1.p1 TRINITY_DN8894_c0_g1~~TRINITY_DN8894_c0_g1_i1.p1  ORF type:complete len:604 (-),score=91.27 TRINITY_DN8894_c0_g1_i1:131-1942(-)
MEYDECLDDMRRSSVSPWHTDEDNSWQDLHSFLCKSGVATTQLPPRVAQVEKPKRRKRPSWATIESYHQPALSKPTPPRSSTAAIISKDPAEKRPVQPPQDLVGFGELLQPTVTELKNPAPKAPSWATTGPQPPSTKETSKTSRTPRTEDPVDRLLASTARTAEELGQRTPRAGSSGDGAHAESCPESPSVGYYLPSLNSTNDIPVLAMELEDSSCHSLTVGGITPARQGNVLQRHMLHIRKTTLDISGLGAFESVAEDCFSKKDDITWLDADTTRLPLSAFKALQGSLTQASLRFSLLDRIGAAGLRAPCCFSQLQLLDLSCNRVVLPDRVDELANCCPALRFLDLSSNSLEALPRGFDRCLKLQWLVASWNRLGSNDLHMLSKAPALESLILDHNRVKRLPPSVVHFPKLEFLSLTNNEIRSLSALAPLRSSQREADNLQVLLLWGCWLGCEHPNEFACGRTRVITKDTGEFSTTPVDPLSLLKEQADVPTRHHAKSGFHPQSINHHGKPRPKWVSKSDKEVTRRPSRPHGAGSGSRGTPVPGWKLRRQAQWHSITARKGVAPLEMTSPLVSRPTSRVVRPTVQAVLPVIELSGCTQGGLA